MTIAGLYQANVDAHVWSEGEGLAVLLGLMTGETQVGQVPGGDHLQDHELTGLLMLSLQFLENNPSGALHDRVQKAVNRLIVPLDQLDQFAKPGKGIAFRPANGGSGAALPVSYRPDDPAAKTSSGLRQAQIDCQALWANGFTTAATPLVCFEYAEDTVSGTRIRLYYPSYWPAGDPRLRQLGVLLRAVRKSVQTFTPYGPQPMPAISMVVTELPYTDPSVHASSRVDAAAMQPAGRPNDCYVAAFPALFSHPDPYLEQVLAHELFHCYEYRNLPDQIFGPAYESTKWWVEGGAEFFGNVVYPASNAEYDYLPRLEEDLTYRNLVQFQYDAFIFWQYLENRSDTGIPGILRLLRSLPASGGEDDQLNGLAAYPNIDLIFHEFCEALVDERIRDSDGTYIPFHPEPIADRFIGAPGASVILHADPFLVGFTRVHFAGGKDYTLQATATGGPPGIYHAELPDTVGSWGAVPDRLNVACGEGVIDVLVTQARAVTGSDYDVRLNAAWQPSTSECDQCLLGAWLLDDASYLNFLNNLIAQKAAGAIVYTGVSGEDQVKFTPDLHMAQWISSMQINAKMSVSGASGAGSTHLLEIQINGDSSATFSTAGGQLSFGESQSNLAVATRLDGQALGAPVDLGPLSSGPLGSGGAYTCTEDALQIVPSLRGVCKPACPAFYAGEVNGGSLSTHPST